MIQCSFCHQKFARLSSLQRHLDSKHLEKRHRCSHCNESFARRDLLLRHTDNYHRDGLKPCLHCSRKFRKDYLIQHQLTCERKRNLTGQSVTLNARRTSPANDMVYSADAFQVPLQSNALLHRPDAADAAIIHSEVRNEGHASDLDEHQISEISRRDVQGNPSVEEVNVEAQSRRVAAAAGVSSQERQQFDQLGRLRIDTWPTALNDYPGCPWFLSRAIFALKRVSPNLSVVATMQPHYVNVATNEVTHSNSRLTDVPHGVVLYMLPCIRCDDCHDDHVVLDPKHAIDDFLFDHMNEPLHMKNFRKRLIASSTTLTKAISFITRGDPEAFRDYVSGLVDGSISTKQMTDDYYTHRRVPIFALAFSEGEQKILAYLFNGLSQVGNNLDKVYHSLEHL